MGEQPGAFGEEGRGVRNEPDTHDIATDRAGTTSPASSSTPTRRRAASLLSITWSMAGGAPVAPPWYTIERWEPTSHTGAGSQGTAGGRARTIKADPGAGVPATSGVEPYSAAALDGWRRRGTNRRPEPVSDWVRRTDSGHAARRTAAASWSTESTGTDTDTIIPPSMKPISVC